ncbi:MAG: ParB/RepB/Spo0J family partition protein [Clostridiales bacterium]|nr:ParB/RepB/Spo0J family partition protein [Clostridiales bacterium]
MAGSSRGLGKGLKELGGGLNSIIPKNPDIKKVEKPENVSRETYIDIDSIEPNKDQPRESFNEESIKELANSIKQYGIIQPLILQKNEDIYNIIAGERRWRAAKLAGLKKVPAIIKEYTPEETLAIALIENIQREDLNPIEEAKAFQNLITEYKLTQEELAEKISKSRTSITNSIRLLKLDKRVQQFLIEGKISTGHGRTLITISDKNLQFQIACKIYEEGLSVREVELLVKDLKDKDSKVKENDKVKDKDDSFIYLELENRLESIVGTKVKIKKKANNKGKIEIEYYSTEDLERLIELFNQIES